MSKYPLTVVIVTKDRKKFFKKSLESVLSQNYQDFKLLILDGGKKQPVESLIERKKSEREIFYEKIDCKDIIEAWNFAVSKCETEYISIFHDDDVMHSDFLDKSMEALLANPNVGMSYTQANKVDEKGEFISLWSENCVDEGVVEGFDYLWQTIKFGCCITIAPTVIVKKEVYNKVGPYADEFCFNVFDFNYWIRVAREYSLHFIAEPLVDYRVHTGQMSQTYWWDKKAKGRLATMFELQNAITILLTNFREKLSSKEVSLLIRKAQDFNKEASRYSRDLVPGL
jgi:glycosyltransferase involved in cell wall biosynthesis